MWWVELVNAQAAPQLTAKYVDRSYDVPLTVQNSTNPYTGQQETTSEGGYHVDNRTIELTIKNPAYNDRDWLCYNVRYKGHFTSNWTTLYGHTDGYSPRMTNSDYTTVTFIGAQSGQYSGPDGAIITAPTGQIDIQVAVLR
jgi:hypothetical protein